MTAKKDLKRHIRARQAETGESYVTARRHVLARAPNAADTPDKPIATAEAAANTTPAERAKEPAACEPTQPRKPVIAVDELVDLTAEAAALGFACRAHGSGQLAKRAPHAATLTRLRAILYGTTEDPAFEKFRAVCLRGERAPGILRHPEWLDNLRQFIQRARVGLGGISLDGTMLAFPVGGNTGSVMVLAHVGARPVARPPLDRPRLVLSAVIDEGFSMSTVFVP